MEEEIVQQKIEDAYVILLSQQCYFIDINDKHIVAHTCFDAGSNIGCIAFEFDQKVDIPSVTDPGFSQYVGVLPLLPEVSAGPQQCGHEDFMDPVTFDYFNKTPDSYAKVGELKVAIKEDNFLITTPLNMYPTS